MRLERAPYLCHVVRVAGFYCVASGVMVDVMGDIFR
jgi:hypothetical protein